MIFVGEVTYVRKTLRATLFVLRFMIDLFVFCYKKLKWWQVFKLQISKSASDTFLLLAMRLLVILDLPQMEAILSLNPSSISSLLIHQIPIKMSPTFSLLVQSHQSHALAWFTQNMYMHPCYVYDQPGSKMAKYIRSIPASYKMEGN